MMLAKELAKMHGVKFKRGGTDLEGFDCLGGIYYLMNRMGRKMPDRFGEWNATNYYLLDEKEKGVVIQTAIEYFDSFAQKVKPEFVIALDVIIVRARHSDPYLAVYGGNEVMITTTMDSYIRTLAKKPWHEIMHAWRIPRGS